MRQTSDVGAPAWYQTLWGGSTMELLKKHPLLAFYVLACAVTWAFHIPLALAAVGAVGWKLPAWVHVLGALGPVTASLGVTWATRGTAGLRDLARRATSWQGGWGWLAFALLSPGVCFLAAGAAISLFRGDTTALAGFGYAAELPQLGWLGTWLLWTLTFGLCEELGWRGFMLPRLQQGRGAYHATLLLGLLWAFWHVPSFFYNMPANPMVWVAFLISILAGSVVMTWLYNSTGGSILIPALWHGAFDTAVAGADGMVAGAVNACVIAGAIVILRRYGPDALSPQPKQILGGGQQ